MNSVGQSYAILNGRLTGDPQKAQEFLSSLNPGELAARNRSESRNRSRKKKKLRLGDKRAY